MVLSGILIRMDLTDRFVSLLRPLLTPVFRVNTDCLYVIIIGFLCGFPMGARIIGELLSAHKIQEKEPIIRESLDLFKKGLETHDITLIGQAATLSAFANQRILYKPKRGLSSPLLAF